MHKRPSLLVFAAALSVQAHLAPAERAVAADGIPDEARYACPMDTHPDEEDPAKRGPYFSSTPGRCPLCGMTLKPLDELDWVRLRRAAGDAEVAYTCPDHQHVFSRSEGECPRCGRRLMPFKVMYTCPDPEHASVIRTTPGNCPLCGRGLAAFRGIWLDDAMADANVPPAPGLAEVAAYRCPMHPLVHSDKPGSCTICARPLESTQAAQTENNETTIPPNAQYTCPMKECAQFSEQPGTCSVCGMRLKPLDQVQWVQEIRHKESKTSPAAFVCPMHPQQVESTEPGTCPVCGMRLVHAASFPWPHKAPEHVAAQIDYMMEHYLALQAALAADRLSDVARQTLAIVSAGETLLKHVGDPEVQDAQQIKAATTRLRDAALKIKGKNLQEDRAAFVALSAAMTDLISVARPSTERWPKLYIYHCPMSKGDWIQSTREKRNPYYGFSMLTCGELKDVK